MRTNSSGLIAVTIGLFLIAGPLAAAADRAAAPPLAWPPGLPVYDHVLFVIEENKDYSQIIGNRHAPYLNQLRGEGANLTRMFGEEHHSQGNYFWLFSGSNQGVGFLDGI